MDLDPETKKVLDERVGWINDVTALAIAELDSTSSRSSGGVSTTAAEALLVNGGGVDGGDGVYFANAGEDVHAVGSLQPLAPAVGCMVIRPDGSRVLARAVPDPLAE